MLHVKFEDFVGSIGITGDVDERPELSGPDNSVAKAAGNMGPSPF
jgi:hypothetical protein